MRLLRYVRRYGLRTGWDFWQFGRLIEGQRRLEAYQRRHDHPFRRFHGKRPDLPAWKRR